MEIITRLTVRQAVARAMLLGATQNEAVATAAESLHLSIESVEECVELTAADASDSQVEVA